MKITHGSSERATIKIKRASTLYRVHVAVQGTNRPMQPSRISPSILVTEGCYELP